ncbi:MAG: hypothetical protein J0I47_06165 [Sphingomonas sp.]|uniref:hypothetical protein n=1 Tax=Sphingomonas sp. TaxID=28214 RepID=UPI001AD1B51E|nr:hypothetical protein [Sphingomonas sp.]MBN8807804.1 hypothetical protein [Sphingomonas sp.]
MREPTNTLVVGFDSTAIVEHIPRQGFLFIDDDPIPVARRATAFDFKTDSFNPLKDMNHIRAAEFIAVLDAIFPEGSATLTRRYSNHILFKQLLEKPDRLSDMIVRSKDPYERDASERIERLLLSPVLKRVLNRPSNFSTKGTITAQLPRAEIGDFDAFVLGNMLISQFRGAIIVPDFSFYAHKEHAALIRQNRLIAGITSFEGVSVLRDQFLTIPKKIASQATPEDAEILGIYAGLIPGTDGHTTFVQNAIRPRH